MDEGRREDEDEELATFGVAEDIILWWCTCQCPLVLVVPSCYRSRVRPPSHHIVDDGERVRPVRAP
jgi:hypothetical protein